MQKKFSYSVLKWTLVLGVASSLATACVISGDGHSSSDGGESGIGDGDAGEPGASGGSSSGGDSSNGGSKAGSGGSSTAGTSTGGGGTTAGGSSGSGGTGGSAPAYVPGLCEADHPAAKVAPPSCAPDAKDEEDACRKCVRGLCCEEWQNCYGTNPTTTACGYGPEKDDGGQFGCILKCFFDGSADAGNSDDLYRKCGEECTLQCADADGAIMDSTNALADCSYMACADECFAFP